MKKKRKPQRIAAASTSRVFEVTQWQTSALPVIILVPSHWRDRCARGNRSASGVGPFPIRNERLQEPALLDGRPSGSASARLIPRATGAGARRQGVPDVIPSGACFNDSVTAHHRDSSNEYGIAPTPIVVAGYPALSGQWQTQFARSGGAWPIPTAGTPSSRGHNSLRRHAKSHGCCR